MKKAEAVPAIKEEALVKRQVRGVVLAAESLTIKTVSDLPQAADLLSKIKGAQKVLKDRKEEITKPLNESLRAVRELFRPLETACERAEGIVKRKMIEVRAAADAAAERAREQVMKQAQRLKPETIARKLDAIEEAPERVGGTAQGGSSFKTIRDVIVEDEAKVPRKYLVLDMAAIRRDALNGVVIPGVRVEERIIVAAS